MKFRIDKNKLPDNPIRVLRRFGYALVRDRQSGTDSLVKRLSSGFYPRFHIYVQEEGDQVVFNLHLDHKQDTIAASRHNAEYQGDLVEQELQNLKNFIDSLAGGIDSGEGDSISSSEKGSFWNRLRRR